MRKPAKNKPKKTKVNSNPDVKPVNTSGASIKFLPVGICLILTFLVYANTINHEYTVDDATVISKNEMTKNGVSSLGEIFSSPYRAGFWDRNEGLYRPISVAMFAIEYELWPDNPMPGHLINIILYLLTVFLVYKVIIKLFGTQNYLFAFAATIIFALHPLHTEVVANIKSRDEILCLLLALVSIYYLIKYLDRSNLVYLIISAALYFICFLSKESAITIFAIFSLVIWYKTKTGIKSMVKPMAMYLFVVAVYMMIRYSVLGSITGDVEHQLINNSILAADNISDRLGSAMMIMGRYLYLLFIPHPLSFDYSYSQIPLSSLYSIKAIIPLLIFGYLMYWAIRSIPKKNAAAFGIVFFLVTISLVSNILMLIESSMAERFLYMPSLGFAIAVGWILVKLTHKKENAEAELLNTLKANIPFTVIIVIIAAGYSFKTIARNSEWKSNLTLLESDVKTSPNSARIRYAYGSTLLIEKALQEDDPIKKNNYLDKSIVQLEKGVSILSTYSEAWYHLGLAYKEKGEGAKAINAFETARQQKNFDKADFYIASGIAYGMTGNYDAAIADLKIAISIDPQNAEAYNNLGLYYADKGVVDSAITALNRALTLKETFPEAWYNKGNAYAKGGLFDQAIASYNTAIQQKPEYTDAILNLGNCYAAQEKYTEAIKYFEQVVSREPKNKKALINLGITYNLLGDEAKGKEYLSIAEGL
jgi:protein O-mannosyl-transferase